MEALILTIIATSIPLLLAATGELITEKSGVLNLGVEGMMLSGAVGALGAVLWLENPYFGIIAGALSGIFMASIFSIFTINFMTNQVATGLGLTIFATGLTGLAGAPLVGKTIPSLPKIEIFLLSDIPVIGNILFKQDFIAYLSVAIIIIITYFLKYSKPGVVLRAVGDDHQSAHSVGYPVKKIRWYATCFGGMCAGIGGAYIPLVLTPHWSEGMTAGRLDSSRFSCFCFLDTMANYSWCANFWRNHNCSISWTSTRLAYSFTNTFYDAIFSHNHSFNYNLRKNFQK